MELHYQFLIVAAFLVIGGLSDNRKVLDCLKKNYENSLGEPFKSCYNKAKDLPIPRIKKCYQECMKEKEVVQTASNGQMTVNRDNFGRYADQNNKTAVGKAMKTCYSKAPAGDVMYQEAARPSQCVFTEMQKTCPK